MATRDFSLLRYSDICGDSFRIATWSSVAVDNDRPVAIDVAAPGDGGPAPQSLLLPCGRGPKCFTAMRSDSSVGGDRCGHIHRNHALGIARSILSRGKNGECSQWRLKSGASSTFPITECSTRW